MVSNSPWTEEIGGVSCTASGTQRDAAWKPEMLLGGVTYSRTVFVTVKSCEKMSAAGPSGLHSVSFFSSSLGGLF